MDTMAWGTKVPHMRQQIASSTRNETIQTLYENNKTARYTFLLAAILFIFAVVGLLAKLTSCQVLHEEMILCVRGPWGVSYVPESTRTQTNCLHDVLKRYAALLKHTHHSFLSLMPGGISFIF